MQCVNEVLPQEPANPRVQALVTLESEDVKVEVWVMFAFEEGGSTRTQPPLQYRRQRWWTRRKKVVSKMLTELNLADKYLHKLESERIGH